MKMNNKLIEMAKIALKKSYSPYSNFKVGAALLCKDGSIFCGSNVECSTYGATICAERAAIVKAVNSGKREFLKIAVVSQNKSDFCYPCGICRQMLAEFACDIEVICAKPSGEYKAYRLNELLPNSFNKEHLK